MTRNVVFNIQRGGAGSVEKEASLKKVPVYDATPMARRRAENIEGGNNPKDRILIELVENGPCTLDDLAAGTGMGKKAVQHHLKNLGRNMVSVT